VSKLTEDAREYAGVDEYGGAVLLREIAATLDRAEAVIAQYSGWWDGSPEDSWRLERDMRSALGVPEYVEEEW
jgi:hypothetical protein